MQTIEEETKKDETTTTHRITSSQKTATVSDSMKTIEEKKIISTENTQEITTTMKAEVKVTIQSHINATSENNKEFTMSSFRTSGTISVENVTDKPIKLQNITEAVDQYVTITGKKRMYQPHRVLIIIAIMTFTVLALLIGVVTVIKCRKYRKIRRNRRRHNKIFREVGMIPMTSVVNERYMGAEER